MATLLRPVAIAAGGFGIFQGIVWGILSLLAILLYKGVIQQPVSPAPSEMFEMNLIMIYFNGTPALNVDIMTPGTVAIWTSLYLGGSIVLSISSGMLLKETLESKFRTKVHMLWLAAMGFTSLIDFMATVCFGLDITTLTKAIDEGKPGVDPLHIIAAGLMMLLTARGFVLWFINVAVMLYMAYAAVSSLEKEEDPKAPNTTQDSTQNAATRSNQGRMSPIHYQPEPISAWNLQSPTIGNVRRSPWTGPGSATRVPVLPRPGRPLSSPPLPTPQPDYSPPLGRPVRHEPNLKDVPVRSALKKPYSPLGRTIL